MQNQVGIIGSGIMAQGICFALLKNGYRVSIITNRPTQDVEGEFKNKISYYSASFGRDVHRLFRGINFYNYDTCPPGLFFMIEATSEHLNCKKQALALSKKNKQAIIATNTSSISLAKLSEFTADPAKFIGLHFLNPPHLINFVEIIKTDKTSLETINFVRAFCRKIKKEYVIIDDIPGFIINRLLFLQINEALGMIEQYKIDPREIDNAMKKGAQFDIGPIRLLEIISTDVCLNSLKNVYERTNDKAYEPKHLLEELVRQQIFGIKNNTSVASGIRKILSL